MPFAHFVHPCGNDLVLKVEMEDVPYFNAHVYLENKESIGKIDEIFGSLHDYFVSVKLTNDMKATSFKVNDKVLFFSYVIINYVFFSHRIIITISLSVFRTRIFFFFFSSLLILLKCYH